MNESMKPAAPGVKYWRSLEQLAESAEGQAWLKREASILAEMSAVDRRGFFRLLGASLALAGVGACSRPPQGKLVPYVRAPAGQVDGLPRFFASTLTRCGHAHGVLVESHMGRPTKIEGNPQHPASLGATDLFAQASVLQLWDPDRSQAVMHRGGNASWDDFDAALLEIRTRCGRNAGEGLRILTGAVTSPTLAAQLDALRRQYPSSRWHVHEPAGYEQALEGTRLAFGKPLAPRVHVERADVIVALDADFLCDPIAGVRYARDFIGRRSPEAGVMSRLYVIEPTPSLTGAMADHRLPLECTALERFASLLAVRLGASLGAQKDTEAVADDEAAPIRRWLDALTEDLEAHRGRSLLLAGRSQPPWVHALVAGLNSRLGNVGVTVEYTEPVEHLVGEGGSLESLVSAMRAGGVDTLLMLDTNPAYDAPADLRFAEALGQVPHSMHLGLYYDETAAVAEWHLPMTHALEAWSDACAFDGTVSLAQPLMAALYGGRSAHELLAALLADEMTQGAAIVRRQWRSRLTDEDAWERALRHGFIEGTALAAAPTELRSDWQRRIAEQGAAQLAAQSESQQSESQQSELPLDAGALELIFRPDPTIDDGRWANNAWLQELPKPLTQLTWGNAALISPQLAAQRALSNGDVVELQVAERTIRAPVWIAPGQAPRCVTLHLGYGRTRAGHVGNEQGVSAYTVRRSQALWLERGVQLRSTHERAALAATQHHFDMGGREPVRVTTLEAYHAHPQSVQAAERWPPRPPSLYPEQSAGSYAWGMSIDLNACIGCKACTIACQAENNIPVVGRDQVQRGREMHWLRVDRYYEGAAENPRSYSQPVPCMMCEHAPCEVVCPVEATVHDAEGLNLQVYNRCIGTRFCSNNCPYKVRRFNFLEYVDRSHETLQAQRNPEVSVRRRGVMEKCTYCIQRIEAAHIQADKESRRVRDGDVLTACQAVCPTQAIRFGDVSDATAAVAQAKSLPRNYTLLAELNTRPRTSYLARVRNPASALEDR